MLRYAFVVNLPKVTPKTYSVVYKNESCHCMVAGVDGPQMGKKFVEKLLEKEFTAIDLSSDFDADTVGKIREMTGERARIRHVQYTIDGNIRLNFTKSFQKSGLIIVMKDVPKITGYLLKSHARDTQVVFAGNLRQAKQAAQQMITRQASYIELSYWFDRLRMDAIARAIGYKVAVGTCGDLDMKELIDDPPDGPERITINRGKTKGSAG